jgi:hypothetical protein
LQVGARIGEDCAKGSAQFIGARQAGRQQERIVEEFRHQIFPHFLRWVEVKALVEECCETSGQLGLKTVSQSSKRKSVQDSQVSLIVGGGKW